MVVMDLVAAQGLAVFMARVAAQAPAFRDVKEAIINNNLVKKSSSSSSRVTRANRNS